MIVFADSSAIVTRYAPNEVSVLPTASAVMLSAIARVEVPSALWRKADAGELTVAEAQVLVRGFESHWNGRASGESAYRPVAIVESILIGAAAITAIHGLRSLDAIQLASALAARAVERECRTMVVLDERLRRAAATEGFDLLPVTVTR